MDGIASKYYLVDLTLFWRDDNKKMVNGEEVDDPKYSPVLYSMNELREDAVLWNFNAKVEKKIQELAAKTLKESGMTNTINLPVVFMAPENDLEFVGAYSPDLANFKTTSNKKSVFPSQFFAPSEFPKGQNFVDLFEKDTKTKIPTASFADDFNGYHDSHGEIHCATAAVRKIFENLLWWEKVK